MQTTSCRLCAGATTPKFSLEAPPGTISYFECVSCGSLQTQEPTWLEQAYAQSNMSDLDTGSVQRALHNCAFILLLAKLLPIHKSLDFGGGNGLLCRMLRDRGLDAHSVDNYCRPTYARRYEGSLSNKYDLITAFEVFEHLPRPAIELGTLFSANARFIVATTEVYLGQDASWFYLCPEHGQHVFFYSRKALANTAKRYSYTYYPVHQWHLFATEPIPSLKLAILKKFSSSVLFKLFRATLPFSESWRWIMRDLDEAR
jgi:Methyltransferase domain